MQLSRAFKYQFYGKEAAHAFVFTVTLEHVEKGTHNLERATWKPCIASVSKAVSASLTPALKQLCFTCIVAVIRCIGLDRI